MLPEMYRVDSAVIYEVGHKEDCNELYVRLIDESIFIYYGVKKEVFESFKNSPEIGHFLLDKIEDCYTCRRYKTSGEDNKQIF